MNHDILRYLGGGRFTALDSDLLGFDPRVELAERFTMDAADPQAATISEIVAKAKPNIRQDVDGVAIINVHGALRPDPGFLRVVEAVFGMEITPTYGEIRQEVRSAASDPSIYSTILHMSTPGGSVFGVGELADEVYSARSKGKRIKSYAQDMMASAGYWIGAQAGEVVANEIAHVGSIGVFAVVVDSSAAAEAEGYRVIPVRSTAGKAGIIGGAPVDDDAIADMRERIENVAGVFVSAVARGRKMKLADAAKLHTGKVYLGHEEDENGDKGKARAVAAGLVDRIASFDELVGTEVRAARQLRANSARSRMSR